MRSIERLGVVEVPMSRVMLLAQLVLIAVGVVGCEPGAVVSTPSDLGQLHLPVDGATVAVVVVSPGDSARVVVFRGQATDVFPVEQPKSIGLESRDSLLVTHDPIETSAGDRHDVTRIVLPTRQREVVRGVGSRYFSLLCDGDLTASRIVDEMGLSHWEVRERGGNTLVWQEDVSSPGWISKWVWGDRPEEIALGVMTPYKDEFLPAVHTLDLSSGKLKSVRTGSGDKVYGSPLFWHEGDLFAVRNGRLVACREGRCIEKLELSGRRRIRFGAVIDRGRGLAVVMTTAFGYLQGSSAKEVFLVDLATMSYRSGGRLGGGLEFQAVVACSASPPS